MHRTPPKVTDTPEFLYPPRPSQGSDRGPKATFRKRLKLAGHVLVRCRQGHCLSAGPCMSMWTHRYQRRSRPCRSFVCTDTCCLDWPTKPATSKASKLLRCCPRSRYKDLDYVVMTISLPAGKHASRRRSIALLQNQ